MSIINHASFSHLEADAIHNRWCGILAREMFKCLARLLNVPNRLLVFHRYNDRTGERPNL